MASRSKEETLMFQKLGHKRVVPAAAVAAVESLAEDLVDLGDHVTSFLILRNLGTRWKIISPGFFLKLGIE